MATPDHVAGDLKDAMPAGSTEDNQSWMQDWVATGISSLAAGTGIDINREGTGNSLDLLGGMSRDQLGIFSWVASAVFVLAVGVWRPRKLHWTVLGAVLLFAALNAGAGIYVLNHVGDPRWSAGEQPLSAPSFSGTPMVGQFLGPLDSALDAVVDGVNAFLAFKQALPVALGFLGTSGWALLVSFPLGILATVVSYIMDRRRAAAFDKYRATVDQLKIELEEVKRQISSGNAVGTAVPDGDELTDVRPVPTARADAKR
ncbi:UNVERIFIED_ORG: hypothetical protein J2X79_002945 [Arthrobacter globiformis]|nr:hypothetical protein [Arthrobacter globiformis]